MIYGKSNWEPMSEALNEEFIRFIAHYDSADYRASWNALNDMYGTVSSTDEGRYIFNFIEGKVQKNEPFSIVRLGDGEGTVLFSQAFNRFLGSNLENYLLKRISYIIFGDHNVVPRNKNAFIDMMCNSIDNADILGLPEVGFVQRRLDSTNRDSVDVRAVAGSMAQIRFIEMLSIENKISSVTRVCSAWLSRNLLPYYKKILNLFENVVIISGNNQLDKKLTDAYCHSSISQILIPTQRSMLNGDGSLPHWPNRFLDVCHEMSLLPKGTLVLVAAGLLGKEYCCVAKKNGHSVIDIGHVADIWCGNLSRPGVDDAVLSKWCL